MSSTLRVIGENFATTHELPALGRAVIGRDDGCEVQIRHASVSRQHAVLHLGPRPRVEDLRSTYGTRVGRKQLERGRAVELEPGDVIDLGVILLALQWSPSASPELVVADQASLRVQTLIADASPSDASVLLSGEPGVGKAAWAEALHRLSPRAGHPFIRLSCAALPDDLLENELFGYECGAFPGATHAKPGLLEAASGGTALLDEVGELDQAMQTKLLRVIENQKVLRLGGHRPRPIDLRLVSSTTRDLAREVEAGRFRRDLFGRLSGITVAVPPLRDRPADIQPLAQAFLARAAAGLGRTPPRLSAAALQSLRRHKWPGNVGKLEQVIASAVSIAGQTIEPRTLGLVPATHRSPTGDRHTVSAQLRCLERDRILATLSRCGGNQAHAAQELGISHRTLLARLREYSV